MSLARLLPPPLHFANTDTEAHSEACVKEVLVRVKGDGDEAREFETKVEDDESQERLKTRARTRWEKWRRCTGPRM